MSEIEQSPEENLDFSLEAIAHSEELAIVEKSKAKKKQLILSIIIGVGTTLAILGFLTLFVKFIIPDEPAVLSIYSASAPAKVVKQEKPKKIPPPTAEIPIVSTNTNATVTIETPEIDIPEIDIEEIDLEAEDFEMSIDDFGGLELDGLDSDMSSMFAQVKAPKSVVFVIDYSLSMKGRKNELAKEELSKALKRLKNGTKYQIIFFGSPFWLAEDKVTVNPANRFVDDRIDINGNAYKRKGRDLWLNTDGEAVPINIQYRMANDVTLNESVQHVLDNPMTLGTAWINPLKLALTLKPEVIYFMTDGAGGKLAEAEQLAKEAEAVNTVINTIAFMIPESVQNIMLSMAELSGGLFTVVNKNGEHEIKNLKK